MSAAEYLDAAISDPMAVRASQVETRLGRLAENIADLEATIDRLRSRLGVVLLSEADGVPADAEPTPEMSALAELIDNHATRLRQASLSLSRLVDRIDL